MFIGTWQWLDWTNVPGALDWIAFLLGGAGIAFTVVQLVRSKGALNAARDALVSTRASLMRNQLVGVLPAFEEIAAAVDAGVLADDRSETEQALKRFCYRSAEAVTLLRESTADFDAVVEQLKTVADLAGTARAALFDNPGMSVQDIAGAAASGIRNLAPEISGVAVSLKNDPGKVQSA